LERDTLHSEKEQRTLELLAAERQASEVRESGARQRRELWQRLKRQAVVQSAAVRELQTALSATREDHLNRLRAAAVEKSLARYALDGSAAEVASLRDALRSAEEAHVRELAATGVTALKHGRKGKPHPRHVRCTPTRLEWGRADTIRGGSGSGGGGGGGGGGVKHMPLQEINAIEVGLATDVARRSGKASSADLFLCVRSAVRTLDLEFASTESRDAWCATLRKWRELNLADGLAPAPLGMLPFGGNSTPPASPARSRTAASTTTPASDASVDADKLAVARCMQMILPGAVSAAADVSSHSGSCSPGPPETPL
jgi:hypothetical protein